MGTVERMTDRSGGDARAELRALMDERGWSTAEAARRAGVSATAIGAWLRGEYRGRADRIESLARRLLRTERDAAGLAAAGLDRHADLAITEQIAAAAAHAHTNADLVVVFGAAGGGKTAALRRYCTDHAGAWMVTMSPAVTTPAAALGRIAEELDGSTSEGTAARLERAVVSRLSVGRALLVVDEAHHLSQALLDVVRCVHDAAGCGLLLAGNEPLWGRLARGERAAQLVSRVGLRFHLRHPAPADVLALAETLLRRAPAGPGRRAVLAAGRGVGALRAVRKLVAQSLILARGDGRDAPADQDLADAAELLAGA